MRCGGCTRFDAIVIGGGPAGALTALHLAKQGWHTALIERGGDRRTKTCGHCLNPRAFSILDRADVLNHLKRITLGTTRQLAVVGQHRRTIELGLDRSDQCGIIVARKEFDQLLRDRAAAAGANIWQSSSARIGESNDEETVVDVLRDGETKPMKAPLIVGADGVGSAVARRMGLLDGGRVGRKLGFSFDIAAESAPAIKPGTIAMFLMPCGYLGIVQQTDQVVHVAGLMTRPRSSHSRDPMTFVRDCAANHPKLQGLELHKFDRNNIANFAATGPMPWRPRLVANRSAALLGDAAGYIEPFTGEGMTWALHSAELLAETLADCPAGNWNERLARSYSQLWRQRIGSQQRLCRALSFALERRAVTNLMFRAGRMFPAMTRGAVARVVAA